MIYTRLLFLQWFCSAPASKSLEDREPPPWAQAPADWNRPSLELIAMTSTLHILSSSSFRDAASKATVNELDMNGVWSRILALWLPNGLNLLSTPCIVGIARIWWRLYRWNVFQRDIGDAHSANDRASNGAQDFTFEDNRANEDVEDPSS